MRPKSPLIKMKRKERGIEKVQEKRKGKQRDRIIYTQTNKKLFVFKSII